MDLEAEKPVLEAKIKEMRRARNRQGAQEVLREQRQLQGKIARLEETHPAAPVRAMVLEDLLKPHDSPVFIRGYAGNKCPLVPRRFPEILSATHRPAFTSRS